MKRRTVKRHQIDTQPLEVEPPLDTSSFDAVPSADLVAAFERRYAAALPRLIDIAMGQLAMDKALKNLESALTDINEELRPATPEAHATIEAAHTQAYRYVVITEALRGSVGDEHLHDTTLRFMEAHSKPASTDVGLRKVLMKAMREAGVPGTEPPRAGVQPNPNGDGAANPFGVTTHAPVQRGTPVVHNKRGGRGQV